MPRLRKAIFNGRVYFLTVSIEEGIMLPANPLVKFLIKSALVKAYKHHPVEICHFIVNGNHIHLIVIVNNPEDIPGFMERFKTESAHYLNRILGRRKRTVWCKSYDSPALLTAEDVIQKIVYLYTNPVKDGLIQSINQYPGLSSWQNYRDKIASVDTYLINRTILQPVCQRSGHKIFKNIKNLLIRSAYQKASLILNPDGWMRAFILDKSAQQVNQEIIDKIAEREKIVMEETRFFKGRLELENQGIDLTFQSSRSGRKMWCISHNLELRKAFIRFVRFICDEARTVLDKFKLGDYSVRFPPGLFPPRLPYICNLLSCKV